MKFRSRSFNFRLPGGVSGFAMLQPRRWTVEGRSTWGPPPVFTIVARPANPENFARFEASVLGIQMIIHWDRE